ncbi:Ig-like domain-containing protein [Herbiconiux moechotypicola]|uniref:Ig-like domain-containing protein n=1 Tax=Herbiconiux moechotypicola TaxID=637393 RepID=UPI0031DF5488|nr:Ig-like domain-containing protein [Herbiconiux moechotypicola]
MITAAALSLSALPALAAPAGPASALQIDCSYSPGLKDFIDAGGAPGTKCIGSGGSGGSGSSTGSSGSSGSGGSKNGTNCQPHQNLLPPFFLENATRGDSTSYSNWVDHATGAGTTTVRNYLNNRLHGSLQFYRQFKDGRISFLMIYSLYEGGKVSQAIYSSTQPCGTGYTYIEPTPATAPSGSGDVREHLAAPGAPTTPLLGRLETRGSLTPIPGSSDRYFVRIDLTNPAGALATPAEVLAEFGGAFDLESIASIPGDAECDLAARAIEKCSVGALDGGATRSFLFTARAKPGVAADAELPVTVSNLGLADTPIEFTEGLVRTQRLARPITNLYSLVRPAPVVIEEAPTTPVCVTETAPGATVLPGTESDQNVLTGTATKLTRLCKNAGGLPMSATALHGTATVDDYGWVTYTPTAGYIGPDTVSVVSHARSGGATSAPATIPVNIVAQAQASDDAYTVVSGTSLTTAPSILANDAVPPTEGWMIQQGTTPPAHGTLALDTKTGRFTYTPAPGYVGTDSFRYRLSGPAGAASNVVTVTFTVTAA